MIILPFNSLNSLNTSMTFVKKKKKLRKIFQDYRVEFTVNINIAYFLQQRWRETGSVATNMSSIKEAIKVIKKVNSRLAKDGKQLFGNVKFEFTLIKSYLQLAVSHSQFGDHHKALKCGRKCIFFFTSLINNIKRIFVVKEKEEPSNPKRKENRNRKLIEEFNKTLSVLLKVNRFVETVLLHSERNDTEFLDNLDFSDFDDLFIEGREPKLQPEWLDSISVANFMHVEYVPLRKIDHNIDFEEISTESFLSLLLLLAATLYFMISTEKRLCGSNDNDFKIRPLFEQSQTQHIQKQKGFVFRFVYK